MSCYSHWGCRITKQMVGVAVLIAVCIELTIALGVDIKDDHNKPDEAKVAEEAVTTPDHVEGLYAFKHAAVASDSALCSTFGRNVLQDGGHAVDAAIAAALCVGVINPHSTGIGGGGFAIIYDRNSQTAEIIDARETVPRAATQRMYDNQSAVEGGLAIGIPGAIADNWMAHQRYGKLPWKRLLQPTIDMMESGVTMTETQFLFVTKNENVIRNNPILSGIFIKDNGNVVAVGEQFTMPLLAETFKQIADGGERAFYDGKLAEEIVSEIQAAGGIITLEDLSSYTPARRQPVSVQLDDITMYSPLPPSSGVVVQLILDIIKGYKFNSTGTDGTGTYHRILEAFKFGYPFKELIESMQSDAGASHVCVFDEDGNAVSMTSTMNYDFGSQVVGNVTGIIYNDEMDDFSTPGLTMSPSIMVDKDGDAIMVVGGSGGSRIIYGTALKIHNRSEAIDDIMTEIGSGAESVQGILRRGEWIYAFADERKGGKPAGY